MGSKLFATKISKKVFVTGTETLTAQRMLSRLLAGPTELSVDLGESTPAWYAFNMPDASALYFQ